MFVNERLSPNFKLNYANYLKRDVLSTVPDIGIGLLIENEVIKLNGIIKCMAVL